MVTNRYLPHYFLRFNWPSTGSQFLTGITFSSQRLIEYDTVTSSKLLLKQSQIEPMRTSLRCFLNANKPVNVHKSSWMKHSFNTRGLFEAAVLWKENHSFKTEYMIWWIFYLMSYQLITWKKRKQQLINPTAAYCICSQRLIRLLSLCN